MSAQLPVIFLAFANEYHEGRYLDKLVQEYKALLATLSPISVNENPAGSGHALCELVIRQSASIHDIFDVFQKYEGRVAIFHYAGHADGYQLLLQGKDGEGRIAHGGGLLALLSRKKSLKLVFLNGCSTQKLAQDLVGRGVTSVIGTAASIPDEIAFHLSSRFYKGLALGMTLSGAWEEAKAEALTFVDGGSTKRGLSLREGPDEHFPWAVEFKDDASKEVFQNWNLPEVAKQPLYNLPEPKKRAKPKEPFLFLKPYGPEQAEIFFGRSHYIRDLWLKIFEPSSPKILLLYGESGAGKSSLLDAGLRPRLEMATPPDSDELIFDVRYERRRQDLGLVGTLADILSKSLVAAEKKEAQLQEEDPNLEKIQQIEALAREMETDAASGFLDLVERYRAIQAYQDAEDYSKNLYRTGDLDQYAGDQLREAWLRLEKESGRRLVVILDQVEELFTRPNDKMQNELEDLLSVLKDIFDTPAGDGEPDVQGKIILGYREEFNAKIEARVKDFELSRTSVFLEQLNRKDILDVFAGLESPVVKNFFNISIEDGLPEHVAQTLLKGRDSALPGQAPVAPVLQLLLTKLWRKAYAENSTMPAFTIDAFNAVQSQGKEMEEYFETQMKKVEALKPQLVESGLALDILAFHVSDLNTSRLCHIRDIRRRYRHIHGDDLDQRSEIDELMDLLKDKEQYEIFLLNDQGRGYTSLPHDTLAPIILREYNRSDKLGQRSARILDTKRPDFIRALQTQEEKKVRLDDNDLEVIEEGVMGMRALEDSEQKLLELSLVEREKRMRLRRILVRGGIVAGLFILFLTVMAGILSVSVTDQLNEAIVNSAHEQSLAELNKQQKDVDHLKAVRLAQFAYQNSDVKRMEVVQNLHKLLQDPVAQAYLYDSYYFYEDLPYEEGYYEEYQEDYEGDPGYEEGEAIDFGDAAVFEAEESKMATKRPLTLSVKADSILLSLDYRPDLGLLFSREDGTLRYWPKGDQTKERVIDLSSLGVEGGSGQADADGQWTDIGFSADGKNIQVLTGLDAQTLYLLDEKPVYAPRLEVKDYNYGQVLGEYDLFSGKLVDEMGFHYSEAEISDYFDVLQIGDSALYVADLFSYRLWNSSLEQFDADLYQSIRQIGWKMENDPALNPEISEEKLLYGASLRATDVRQSTQNTCMVWNPGDLGDDAATNFGFGRREFYEPEKVNFFSALTADRALIVYPNGEAEIRFLDGSPSRFFEVPQGFPSIGISPDQKRLYAVSPDKVFLWNLDGMLIDSYAHPGIQDYYFSGDGSRLLTVSDRGVRVWSGKDKLSEFVYPDEDSLVVAHFQGNSHLVVGLTPAQKVGQDGKKSRKSAKARIEYWDLDPKKLITTFNHTGKSITNAMVSEDGNYAVAIEPLKVVEKDLQNTSALGFGKKKKSKPTFSAKATIIVSKQLPRRKRDYNRKGIEPLPARAGQAGESKVFLSPGGKYIVRQSGINQIELFNLQGKPVNAFKVEGGFRPRYEDQLFSSDDYYLIASKTDEVYFWHPEDDPIRFLDYDLELSEKREYGLATTMDYLPGMTQANKYWGIGVLLVVLIFSLLFFSDAIIRLAQGRKYRQLGVYIFGFLVLASILGGIWAAGTSTPGMMKLAFYGIIWSCLLLITLAGLNYWRRQKWQTFGVVAASGLLLLAGSMIFLNKENAFISQLNKKNYAKAVRSEYQGLQSGFDADPEAADYFHQLYLEVQPSIDTAATITKLTDEQLKELAEKNTEVDVYYETLAKDWVWLLWSLVVLLAFSLTVGFPLYRSMKKYQAGKLGASYLSLLWPVGLVMVVIWGLAPYWWEEDLGGDLLELLDGGAFWIILASMIKRSIAYLRKRKGWTFLYYAIPTLLLIGALLSMDHGVYVLAIAVAFVEGRQSYLRKAYGQSFVWFAAGLFPAVGAAILAMYFGNFWLAVGAFLLAPALVFLYLGLRQQRRRMAARRTARRSRLLNWLAAAGMTIAGVFVSGVFSDELYWASSDDYYEEDYNLYYDEETGEYYYYDYEEEGTEAGLESEEPGLEEDLSDDGNPMDAEESIPEEEYLEEETELPEEDLGDREDTGPVDSEPSSTPDNPFSEGTTLNARQQQVVLLFSPSEGERDDARRQLSGSLYRDDPEVIPEIIQYSYLNPDFHAGIWNALFLLEGKSTDELLLYQDYVLQFLEWTSNKGYGPSTMERIDGIRGRIME